MADGLARGKRLAGCSALHGVQGILRPVPLYQDSGHTFCDGSGLPRGQKQDPPSFLKASLRRRLRAGTGYPPPPSLPVV